MEKEKAVEFSRDWIRAWNDHDLDSILSHYDEQIEFYSPFITLLNFNETGVITDKGELRRYFQLGLNAYPNLHFEFQKLFIGMNTIVLYYISVNGRLAAEVFHLDEAGKAFRVFCNYTEN